MIKRVNEWCNVKTGSDTNSIRAKVEITIPRLRANLRPEEARELAAALIQAAEEAEECVKS